MHAKIMQQHKHNRVGVHKHKQDGGARWLIIKIDVGRRHKYISKTYIRVRYLIIHHDHVNYLAIKKSVLFKHSLVNLPHITFRSSSLFQLNELLSLCITIDITPLSSFVSILSFKNF